jgi:hypothetical protein
MSHSLRSLLALLAVVASAASAHAAGKPARRPPAHHARTPPRHVSHSKTNRFPRPAVHRRPTPRGPAHVNRSVRRPVTRTVVRTVPRYPVHRQYVRTVRRPYYVTRSQRVHRRYTYTYYPGRYRWRTNHYNRGYGGLRRSLVRRVPGIVEGIQGNAGNGTVLVKVFRPSSRRFRYGTLAGANAARGNYSVQRFRINNGTRYEMLTTPRQASAFASLQKGERVLIQTTGNSANTAQIVALYPRRKR